MGESITSYPQLLGGGGEGGGVCVCVCVWVGGCVWMDGGGREGAFSQSPPLPFSGSSIL